MSIKMFVTDMDGTLLNSAKEVTSENKAAIKEIAAKGIVVTIATGRMYPSALPYAKQLDLNVPIITYNGALIRSADGEDLYTGYIPTEDVKDILAFCFEHKWHTHLYSHDELYFCEHTERAKAYEDLSGIKGKIVGQDGLYQHCEAVPKMLVITSGAEESEQVAGILNQKFGEKIFAVRSNPEYVEIVKRGVNKAEAVARLAEKYDIKPEEVMVIGDSDNDLPMMRIAGLSVAMGNANDNVLAYCSKITTDCEHSGVAEAIKKYILQA